MLQPAENIHLIGVDPLDPTRSTYVATGDSGQVPALLSSMRQNRGMQAARSPSACAPSGHQLCDVLRAVIFLTSGSLCLQVATMAATAADVLTDVLNDRPSPYADVRCSATILRSPSGC